MNTKIYKINRKNIDINTLYLLKKYIKEDLPVAIPTETVYGLAANGLSHKACEKIFEAKNRPADNPLILHISNMDDLFELVEKVDADVLELLEKLWPGPLTVIMKKSEIIPDTVSAGLDTVAIRMPKDEIARKFIEICKTPLAAPSANLSGSPSPTNALDVLEDMEGRIPAIIDGGSCDIGIESTVLDVSQRPFKILRPGFYTYEYLKEFVSDIALDENLKDSTKAPKSPGQKYRHYAPVKPMEVIVEKDYCYIKKRANELSSEGKKVGLLIFEEFKDQFDEYQIFSLGKKCDINQMSQRLFALIRKADHANLDYILCQGVSERKLGLSIMNRLKKSASGKVFIY